MQNRRVARAFLGGTAVLVGAGLILQLVLTANTDSGSFGSVKGRVFNYFCFFTVQSNIVVAITTGMLAIRLERGSTLFRVFRLVGVVAIAVTGVVFYIALKGLHELTGWDALADFLLHTASPILTVVGWALFGPRHQISRRIVGFAAVPPFCWLVFTMIRGTFVQDVNGRDYYPYPFLNVQEHGYLVVLFNCLLVVVLFFGLCVGALALDKRLPGVRDDTIT